ncbi:MAG: hypothetical protein R6V46_09950 [Desulfatiglandaceae bacterium]
MAITKTHRRLRMNVSDSLGLAFRTTTALLILTDSRNALLLAMRNCVRLDGTMSWARTFGELTRLVKLTAVWVFAPLFFVSINIIILYALHNTIIPVPMAIDIFSVFNIDPVAWEHSIEKEALGDVGAKYEEWSRSRGFSLETAEFLQKHLWSNWIFYLIFALYLLAAFYFLVIRLCISITSYYKKGLLKRKETYFDRDLRTIPQDRMIY